MEASSTPTGRSTELLHAPAVLVVRGEGAASPAGPSRNGPDGEHDEQVGSPTIGAGPRAVGVRPEVPRRHGPVRCAVGGAGGPAPCPAAPVTTSLWRRGGLVGARSGRALYLMTSDGSRAAQAYALADLALTAANEALRTAQVAEQAAVEASRLAQSAVDAAQAARDHADPERAQP